MAIFSNQATLTYESNSAVLFVNGVPQGAPSVTAGPPLVISGLSVPGGGDAVLVYQARANAFADPALGGTIDNTVTVTGDATGATCNDFMDALFALL